MSATGSKGACREQGAGGWDQSFVAGFEVPNEARVMGCGAADQWLLQWAVGQQQQIKTIGTSARTRQ